MLNKRIKFLIATLIVLLVTNIIAIYSHSCYAAEQSDGGEADRSSGMSDVSKDLGYWGYMDKKPAGKEFNDKAKILTTAIRTVGIVVSVGTLSVIGIKFMLGSLEEKAQYKQILIPWVIGAIMVFAMTTIPTIIYEFSTGTFK